MLTIARLRDLDTRTWRAATWTAPFIIQFGLGAMVITICVSGKIPCYTTIGAYSSETVWFLAVAAVAALVSALISGLLLRSPSSCIRGMALSVAGSAAIIFIGAIIYAFWVLRWFDEVPCGK